MQRNTPSVETLGVDYISLSWKSMPEYSHTGRVSKWVEGRGFGFIEYGDSGDRKESIFVHARELTHDRKMLRVDEKVDFNITRDSKNHGKMMAVDVRGEYKEDASPKSRIPRFCLDFNRGDCRYGSRCKYLHEGGGRRRSYSRSYSPRYRGGRSRSPRRRSYSPRRRSYSPRRRSYSPRRRSDSRY